MVSFSPRSLVRRIDGIFCRAQLATVGEGAGIRSFLFHAVAAEDAIEEMDRFVDPTQTLTLAALDSFIRHFRGSGHEFVSPEMIRDGLAPGGRHVLMTFDDGYFNNTRVLPLLKEHGVPAVFFISTNYVERGEAFWWDVVHRERQARGATQPAVLAEQSALKRLRHDEIRAYLVKEFGANALRAAGEDDRPMTPNELRAFAADPHVFVGNHTMDHAILTNHPRAEVERQMTEAQGWLASVIGERPSMVSYPNGGYSEEVLEVASACGFDLGITVDPRTSPNVPNDAERLRLGRYCFTRGHHDEATFLSFRSPVSLRRLSLPGVKGMFGGVRGA